MPLATIASLGNVTVLFVSVLFSLYVCHIRHNRQDQTIHVIYNPMSEFYVKLMIYTNVIMSDDIQLTLFCVCRRSF